MASQQHHENVNTARENVLEKFKIKYKRKFCLYFHLRMSLNNLLLFFYFPWIICYVQFLHLPFDFDSWKFKLLMENARMLNGLLEITWHPTVLCVEEVLFSWVLLPTTISVGGRLLPHDNLVANACAHICVREDVCWGWMSVSHSISFNTKSFAWEYSKTEKKLHHGNSLKFNLRHSKLRMETSWWKKSKSDSHLPLCFCCGWLRWTF